MQDVNTMGPGELVKKLARVQINFPNTETREQKLKRKRLRREQDFANAQGQWIPANLSKNHPDYGLSPAEHLRAKQERENIS
jgi:hypothetical protein